MAEAEYTLSPVVSPPAAPSPVEGERVGSGLEDADGYRTPAGAAPLEDHCVEALRRLITRYKGKPRLSDFLCTLADPLTELEAAAFDVWRGRQLGTAVGVQLDGLGDIVGEPRKDRSDADFEVFIRVKVLVNRSDGTVEDLAGIIRQAFGDDVEASVRPYYPASLVVSIPNMTVDPEDFVLYLRAAKAGGVRLDFVWGLGDDLLIFDDPDGTNHGMGSDTDSMLGGVLAGVS